jgi:hypothetical protein
MGGVISTTEAVTTIALWPLSVVKDMSTDPVTAVAGGAVAVGVPYYLFGNPVPLVQNQEFVTLGFAYGIGGVGYWTTKTLKMKYLPQ